MAIAGGSLSLVAAVFVGVVVLATSGSPKKPCSGSDCGSVAPTSGRASAVPAGPKFRYRTVERDTGYFEGTITIVNTGTRPMPTWTLGFTYPGADIHNAWEVVLQQKGQNVTIVNKPTAVAIPPGKSFEVRFGGAGSPTMPTNCRLNNAPCVFVR